MLYDAKNIYSDAQAVSTSAATSTVGSSNIVDHGPLASDNTSLKQSLAGLWLNIRVTTSLYSSNVGTLAVLFTTADNSGMTSPSTVFTAVPAAVASVGWTAGTEYQIPLPSGTYKRYTQLSLVGAAHIITAGNITAVLADVPGSYLAAAQDASIY